MRRYHISHYIPPAPPSENYNSIFSTTLLRINKELQSVAHPKLSSTKGLENIDTSSFIRNMVFWFLGHGIIFQRHKAS